MLSSTKSQIDLEIQDLSIKLKRHRNIAARFEADEIIRRFRTGKIGVKTCRNKLEKLFNAK